jgi:hypothetical protein
VSSFKDFGGSFVELGIEFMAMLVLLLEKELADADAVPARRRRDAAIVSRHQASVTPRQGVIMTDRRSLDMEDHVRRHGHLGCPTQFASASSADSVPFYCATAKRSISQLHLPR